MNGEVDRKPLPRKKFLTNVYNPDDSEVSSSLENIRDPDNISLVTYRSYAPSSVDYKMEDENDIAGYMQHRLKKLKASTAV